MSTQIDVDMYKNDRVIRRYSEGFKLKIFGDTFGMGNRYNVKGKLLKDSMVTKVVRFRKNASVDGSLSKSNGMSNSYICEFSMALTAYELAIHNHQHMTPVGWCHSDCPVFMFDYQFIKATFWEKLHNLCENIFANVHTCSNLHLSAKEQNSKGRQGFEDLVHCA